MRISNFPAIFLHWNLIKTHTKNFATKTISSRPSPKKQPNINPHQKSAPSSYENSSYPKNNKKNSQRLSQEKNFSIKQAEEKEQEIDPNILIIRKHLELNLPYVSICHSISPNKKIYINNWIRILPRKFIKFY